MWQKAILAETAYILRRGWPYVSGVAPAKCAWAAPRCARPVRALCRARARVLIPCAKCARGVPGVTVVLGEGCGAKNFSEVGLTAVWKFAILGSWKATNNGDGYAVGGDVRDGRTEGSD